MQQNIPIDEITRHRLGGSDPTTPLGFSGITSSFITVLT